MSFKPRVNAGFFICSFVIFRYIYTSNEGAITPELREETTKGVELDG